VKKLLLWFCFFSAYIAAEPVRLASLDWPPFTGARLDGQGETTVLIEQVFKSMGLELHTEFLPWSRASRAVRKTDAQYAGYFPKYYTDNSDFILSDSLGISELGFVEASTKPLGQLSFARLPTLRLGVVQDYVNLGGVDLMISAKQLRPQLAISDRLNVLKVARGRLDLAVIDRRVLSYLLQYDPEVKQMAAGRVHFNDSLTELKTLHLALRRENANQELIEKFNQQLKKIKSDSAALMSYKSD
jgi:polar amino acid transport system substrate-binding protein